MLSAIQEKLADDALLNTYSGGLRPEQWGAYSDCFTMTIPQKVNLEQFVFAFYTSRVFRIERFILRAFTNSPSSDADARAVANGSGSRFAAWYVGERTASQLLMCDRFERTRSWFRVKPLAEAATQLFFGSAVAARRGRDGSVSMGGGFKSLLPFHVLYSQILMRSACAQLGH